MTQQIRRKNLSVLIVTAGLRIRQQNLFWFPAS
jgi:hypothetical protein